MVRKVGLLLGSLLFFWLAPGTVGGLVPYTLSKWRMQPAFLGIAATRVVGVMLATAGVVVVVECFVRFAIKGRGTPAPVAPTEELVVTGLYRHVRNPMYIGVPAAIAGQALLFGSAVLLVYGTVVALFFHAFVRLYEEPTLRRKYSSAYDRYCARVPRWLPKNRDR